MKTLVVLTALAALATAAPTLPENRYGGYRPVSSQIAPTFRREKKSPVEAHSDAVSVLESQNIPCSKLNHAHEHEVTARSFGSNKPIIVKNKLGYHLYRDSDEEQAQADSQEKCTKEVKVKLCDAENLQAKSSDMMARSSASEANIHKSENEMEQNIKIAKETVENLQKMSQWKHSEFGPDAELHKDIEVARQALEHIQQNFENLESMNIRPVMLSDTESLQDAQVQLIKDERMAQWNEAMHNIQKNVEIARNLEDSFSHEHLSHIPKTEVTREKISDQENGENFKTKSNLVAKDAKMKHEPIHQEMKAAATDIKEAKLIPIKPFEELSHDSLFRSKSDLVDKNIHTEMHKEAKSSDFDSSLKGPVAAVSEKQIKAEELTVKSAETMKTDVDTNKVKQSENAETVLNLRNSNSARMESDDKNMIAKTSELAVDQNITKLKSDSLIHEKTANFDASTRAKSVDHQKDENLHEKSAEKDEKLTQLTTPTSEIDPAIMRKTHFHNAAAKSVDQVAHMSEQVNSKDLSPVHHHSDLSVKMVENINAEHQHQLHDFHPQARNWQVDHATSMKNAAVDQRIADFGVHSQVRNSQADDMTSMKNVAVDQKNADFGFHSQARNWEADHMTSMKNAAVEQSKSHLNFHSQAKNWQAEHMTSMKNAAVEQSNVDSDFHSHSKNWQAEHMTSMKNAAVEQSNVDSDFHSHSKNWQAEHMASMKNAAVEQSNVDSSFHSQAKNWQAEHLISMKNTAAEQSNTDFHNLEMQRTESNLPPMAHQFSAQHSVHIPGLPHNHQIHHSSQFGHLHNIQHGLSFRADEHTKTQEKAAEMDNSVQARFQVNMNEPSGMSVIKNNDHWKQQQVGAARGAYGVYGLAGAGAGSIGSNIAAAESSVAASSSGGSGAIGVFPHANTGGCAIPLLLSCSPSVVSGSLAKVHSGYGARTYRSENNEVSASKA